MEKQLLRPYLAFDSVLCDALQHTLPQIIPPSHNEEIMYPLPAVVFRLFDYTDVPEVGFCLKAICICFMAVKCKFLLLINFACVSKD